MSNRMLFVIKEECRKYGFAVDIALSSCLMFYEKNTLYLLDVAHINGM